MASVHTLRRYVRTANRIFASCGLRFHIRGLRCADDDAWHLRSRADRDALSAHLDPPSKGIPVFIVSSLMDVDTPPLQRRGVHWHKRRNRRQHYIIVVADAPRTVLAHELGHYLGHPRHSRQLDNLMSYRRSGTRLPFLTARQCRKLRRAPAVLRAPA